MKTRRIFTILLAAMIFSTSCKKSNEPEAKEMEIWKKDFFGLRMSWLEFNGYKGQIKSLKTTRYNAYSKFGEITLGSIIDEEYIEFDKEGFITIQGDREYIYDIKDRCRTITSRTGGSITKREIQTLNADGFPEQSDSYSPTGELTARIKYKYNNDGRLIEQITYDNKGRATYKLLNVKYGSNGLPASWEDYTATATGEHKFLQRTFKRQYHPNGYLKKMLITEDGTTTAQMVQEVENNRTKKITFKNFYEDGNIWFQNTSIYNNKEELVEMLHYQDGKLEQRTEYESDSIGNIIKETEFEDEEPVAVKLIEIEYYK